ncbi:sigma-70 family RNA polymerase sigma factor [Singulisphaera sp. PoT]|uniref:sigma-70 family RNA polymerase sigma factor n=1 Tax=Singulisphaera sp. PoT TaxID=3411797 RepID=UPI003BF55F0F
MAQPRSSHVLHNVGLLWNQGVAAGLSDAQLLERFAASQALAAESFHAAEVAFEALVSRHGPMVLGVCRRALNDPRDIEDAFQATFLVLVRRAPSVRVEGSLGRWLYGVARRVAARARIRSERMKARSLPLNGDEPEAEPEARASDELLAVVDEELGRLPERYRSAIILCHLEGLTHAQAADRLHCPVGTLSGRLSRGRTLLKRRLVRRGFSSTAGSFAAFLTPEATRAAVPESWISQAARASAELALAGRIQGGAVSVTAVALKDEVLRAALAFKLKACASVLLAVALTTVTLGGRAGAGDQAAQPRGQMLNAVASKPDKAVPSPYPPADELIREIEGLIKSARRPMESELFKSTFTNLADRIAVLRQGYPRDPRVSQYMLDRWMSLNFIGRRAEMDEEVAAVLATSSDDVLRRNALYIQSALRLQDPIGVGRTVAIAERFARDFPGDNQGAFLFRQAGQNLDGAWYTLIGLSAALGVLAATLFGLSRRVSRSKIRGWLKVAFRVAVVVMLAANLILIAYRVQSSSAREGLIEVVLKHLETASRSLLSLQPMASALGYIITENLRRVAWTPWMGLAIGLSALGAYAVASYRGLTWETFRCRFSRGVLASLSFLVILLGFQLVGLVWVTYKLWQIEARLEREYPTSYGSQMVKGARRQSEGLGKPFELEFNDAITGRHISMKDLRGKVVVIDFWATWCGPCVGEVPEMKQVYAEYHDQGVEFIGVSRDLPEEDGGLKDLKDFVAKHDMPWPQYHEAQDNHHLVRNGDASKGFSESWGVNGVPTVFLVDAEGNLSSTTARGKLETLIPRLLKARDAKSP